MIKMLEVLEHQIAPTCSAAVFRIYKADYSHIRNRSDLTADPALSRRLD